MLKKEDNRRYLKKGRDITPGHRYRAMLSIKHIKEIFKNPSLSDEEAIEIRDHLQSMTEIFLEKCEAEQREK